LVWTTCQNDNQAATYEIRFRVVGTSDRRTVEEQAIIGRAPRGFVGDGSHRCAPIGDSTTDMIHSRIALADLDLDGRPDLIVGGARGAVVVYRGGAKGLNLTDSTADLLLMPDGRPLDVGWSAAPLAV